MKTLTKIILAMTCSSSAFADSAHIFINNDIKPISVVMDTCREIHKIKAESRTVFVKANPFDQPTFRVFLGEFSTCNEEILSKPKFAYKVDMQCIFSANCIMEWNGKEVKKP